MELSSTTGGADERGDGDVQPKADVEPEHGLSTEEEEAEDEGMEHQPLETEDLNFDKWKPKPKPKKSCREKMADVKKYLWNPETREFMGRSGRSWSFILLFYSSLYIFLAAMFAACMCALMWSISPYTPTYNDRVMPPGMTLSPRVNGFDIAFNASDRNSWAKYVEALEDYLKPYEDPIQEQRNVQCTRDKYFKQDNKEESAERQACRFKRSWLKDCSGLQDPDFGYSQGKPCVLLQMNRILGYLPGQGTPVTVTCGAKKGESYQLGQVEFYPENLFNLMYYPYYGKLRHVNYTSPLVAVKFRAVQQGTHLVVQCKLNGKGIINDSPTDRFLGSVSFSMEVGA